LIQSLIYRQPGRLRHIPHQPLGGAHRKITLSPGSEEEKIFKSPQYVVIDAFMTDQIQKYR
jgi:hypothetical protein